MTIELFGDTASAARMKQLVLSDLDPEIGLNHQEDAFKLELLGHAKYKYADYRTGTWQEQVKRACDYAVKRFG